MLEPVKPLTMPTPSFWAARAVFFISSIARALTPAGSPSPQTCARQDRLVAFVDRIEHRLADEMIADRVNLQVVALEQIAFGGAIAVVGQGLVDFEMVAPAGQFQAAVAEITGLASHVFQRQIGPLAGEQRDRASHAIAPTVFAIGRIRTGREIASTFPQAILVAALNSGESSYGAARRGSWIRQNSAVGQSAIVANSRRMATAGIARFQELLKAA